jgi:hypothetical protein
MSHFSLRPHASPLIPIAGASRGASTPTSASQPNHPTTGGKRLPSGSVFNSAHASQVQEVHDDDEFLTDTETVKRQRRREQEATFECRLRDLCMAVVPKYAREKLAALAKDAFDKAKERAKLAQKTADDLGAAISSLEHEDSQE